MQAIAVFATHWRRSASFAARQIDFRHYSKSVIIFLFTICLASTSYAQAPSLQGYASIISNPVTTLSKRVEEVNLVVTVTNKRGQIIDDLGESDLQILDNDRPPNRITYFQNQTDLPLRVALLVDSSDSITRRFRFELEAAGTFLKQILRPNTDLALVEGFNQNVNLLQPLTADIELLTKGISSLQPSGETAIYDAVTKACQELMRKNETQPVRKAIILITDGEDNHSQVGLDQAVETALRAETAIYVVSTNARPETPWAEKAAKAMQTLSESTGGHILRSDADSRLGKAFRKLELEMRTQYAIGYKPANTAPDGLFHRLTVLGPKKLRVFHRQGYFAR